LIFSSTGSSDNPFNGSVDIILTGNSPITVSLPFSLPSTDPRIIAVKGGLDLHGSPHNISWTRLAQTASSGDNLITLSQAVDWQTGDEIVITTTDTNILHTERHSINSVINATVILTVAPLAYTHIVIRQTFPNGQVVNVAAAVGLLTRNVRVINQNPAPNLFGIRIFIAESSPNSNNKGYARLSNTQFIGFGKFDDTSSSDQQSGIYMSQLNDFDYQRPTYIDACSFDGGFNAA
jgi:hypothetical protein